VELIVILGVVALVGAAFVTRDARELLAHHNAREWIRHCKERGVCPLCQWDRTAAANGYTGKIPTTPHYCTEKCARGGYRDNVRGDWSDEQPDRA
jgi:hypothetical protein